MNKERFSKKNWFIIILFSLMGGVVMLTLGFFILSTSTSIYVIILSLLPVVLGNALVNILFSAAVKDFIPDG